MTIPPPAKRSTSDGCQRRRRLPVVGLILTFGLALGLSTMAIASDADHDDSGARASEHSDAQQTLSDDDPDGLTIIAITDSNLAEQIAAVSARFPLPKGSDLRYLTDVLKGRQFTERSFEEVVGYNASCAWFRLAAEDRPLSDGDRKVISEIPTWDMFDPAYSDAATIEHTRRVSDAALSGDLETVRSHLQINCITPG